MFMEAVPVTIFELIKVQTMHNADSTRRNARDSGTDVPTFR